MRAMICDLVMEAIFVNFLSLGVAQFYDRGLCSQKKTQKSSSTRVYSIFEFDYEYSSLNSSILEFYRVFYYLINYIIIGYN